MAAPIFLTEDEWFELLLSELPAGVYSEDRAKNDDPNQNSVSSAELRTVAKMLTMVSTDLANTWADKFATTVTAGGLPLWEKEFFSAIQDATQSFDVRQANLIAKMRARGGLSLPYIQGIVAGILDPLGIPFAILPYGGQSNGTEFGAWILGESELGVDTYLAEQDPIIGATRDLGLTPLDNDLDYIAAGLTLEQLQAMQRTAYTYEVQIYGNASAATLAQLDSILTQLEPARSTHVIQNNVSTAPPDPTVYGWSTAYLYWWKS